MSVWLATPRLVLRPFQDADLEAFLTYRNDPEVACYQGWDFPYPRAQAAAFLAAMKERTPDLPGKWFHFAIEPKATGVLAGDCAYFLLERDVRQAEIGFTLARDQQGQGFATEAVRRLLIYSKRRTCTGCAPIAMIGTWLRCGYWSGLGCDVRPIISRTTGMASDGQASSGTRS